VVAAAARSTSRGAREALTVTIGVAIWVTAIAAGAGDAAGRVEVDLGERVRFERSVPDDSVTVGERFTVTWRFDYPDTLDLLAPPALDAGDCRLLSLRWREERAPAGRAHRAADLVLIGLDLERALLPENHVDFLTPSGDTVRVFTGEAAVPVRRLASDDADLAPLKEQWEAPRSIVPWLLGAAAAIAIALAAWLLWKRRRRGADAAPEVQLPADFVALTELSRIERMGLVEAGELKRYYTLVVDAVRRYLEARYGVDAMDRTTHELVAVLGARGHHVDGLEALLGEADLVKFARFTPPRAAAEGAIGAAREIVVRTTPRETAPGGEADGTAAAAGGGA